MKSLSIQGVDEQLSAVLRQHLGLEKPITYEAQQLTGIVGELAGLLKDRDVDESRGDGDTA